MKISSEPVKIQLRSPVQSVGPIDFYQTDKVRRARANQIASIKVHVRWISFPSFPLAARPLRLQWRPRVSSASNSQRRPLPCGPSTPPSPPPPPPISVPPARPGLCCLLLGSCPPLPPLVRPPAKLPMRRPSARDTTCRWSWWRTSPTRCCSGDSGGRSPRRGWFRSASAGGSSRTSRKRRSARPGKLGGGTAGGNCRLRIRYKSRYRMFFCIFLSSRTEGTPFTRRVLVFSSRQKNPAHGLNERHDPWVAQQMEPCFIIFFGKRSVAVLFSEFGNSKMRSSLSKISMAQRTPFCMFINSKQSHWKWVKM